MGQNNEQPILARDLLKFDALGTAAVYAAPVGNVDNDVVTVGWVKSQLNLISSRISDLEKRAKTLGDDQQWFDVSALRKVETEYTNDTDQPIMIVVTANVTEDSYTRVVFTLDGLKAVTCSAAALASPPEDSWFTGSMVIPTNSKYMFHVSTEDGTYTNLTVHELRSSAPT